jgi:hypothetical protein
MGVPESDLRDDFFPTQGFHVLILYETMPWLVSPGLSLLWFQKSCALGVITTFAPAAHATRSNWRSICEPDAVARPYLGFQAPPTIAFPAFMHTKTTKESMWILRDTMDEAVVVVRERSAESAERSGEDGFQTPPVVAAYETAWSNLLPKHTTPVPWFSHEWRIVTREELSTYLAAGWNVRRSIANAALMLLSFLCPLSSRSTAQTVLAPATLPAHMRPSVYYAEKGPGNEFYSSATSSLRPTLAAAIRAENCSSDPISLEDFAGV